MLARHISSKGHNATYTCRRESTKSYHFFQIRSITGDPQKESRCCYDLKSLHSQNIGRTAHTIGEELLVAAFCDSMEKPTITVFCQSSFYHLCKTSPQTGRVKHILRKHEVAT